LIAQSSILGLRATTSHYDAIPNRKSRSNFQCHQVHHSLYYLSMEPSLNPPFLLRKLDHPASKKKGRYSRRTKSPIPKSSQIGNSEAILSITACSIPPLSSPYFFWGMIMKNVLKYFCKLQSYLDHLGLLELPREFGSS
jgi:hypothetical protein